MRRRTLSLPVQRALFFTSGGTRRRARAVAGRGSSTAIASGQRPARRHGRDEAHLCAGAPPRAAPLPRFRPAPAGSQRESHLAIARSDDDVDLLVRHVELHDRDDETAHLGEGLEGRKVTTIGAVEQVLQELLVGDRVPSEGAGAPLVEVAELNPAGDDAIDEEALDRTRRGSVQLGAHLRQVCLLYTSDAADE